MVQNTTVHLKLLVQIWSGVERWGLGDTFCSSSPWLISPAVSVYEDGDGCWTGEQIKKTQRIFSHRWVRVSQGGSQKDGHEFCFWPLSLFPVLGQGKRWVCDGCRWAFAVWIVWIVPVTTPFELFALNHCVPFL